ncbi:SirB2 family protein [Paenalcaligenes niemegkensis]|uniref:SirB2 family protein n=1 Tax=Paenalcaligenes niemegkensis TaxID=2895469 RepID=UPI001EE78E83|nr:SirB2 family protein [Paenalcaligenes niemegkensis]MCQ9615961.1 SirB2 family protein [Paenalcaligenes niemegkensis]
MYHALKHLHVTAAALSILFFVVRAYWSVSESAMLQKKFVRITPHIIDTVFLVCGLALAGMLGAAAGAPWLYTKIALLIAYIAVGVYAIKLGPTPTHRGIAAIVAVLIFIYIVGVALRHNPASWFA